ncbi:Glucan endo-1,3-beta-glucosidase 5 [Cucurbita argyrosperma subsp. argyrosperma]|nr:Glucan endo-1,3-beta-glucosidase 5 [Cucurbita argyrosperma subsp. argyrosperma]
MESLKFLAVRGLFLVLLLSSAAVSSVIGIGVNWGTQSTHPLPPATVVKLLKDNGIQKVKLFDADPVVLNALAKSGIEVMVGIPNDMLYSLANSIQAAENWVAKNLSSYISSTSVDIRWRILTFDYLCCARYVAVGNEPFLKTFNGSFLGTTFPALQNVQAAIVKAGLSTRVKVTVPMNADVYQSLTTVPSGGDFRSDIHDLMLSIVKFLSDSESPFTVNIYPFISLYADPNFPIDYAFFDGFSQALDDNGRVYDNVFTANYDTLVSSLQKNGFPNMSIIVGEIGWPTDGDRNANLQFAKRFSQGFLSRFVSGQGTPMRPGPIDAYLFSLIDEDAKSIQPGNFERHWGLFYYDGRPKYMLQMANGTRSLVPASNVKYQAKQWCVLSPSASLDDPQIAPSVSYACENSDCTSLGFQTSCGALDARQNISYAFNSYYQIKNQVASSCKFPHLSVISTQDPSVGSCRFIVMTQPSEVAVNEKSKALRYSAGSLLLFLCFFILALL